MEEFTTRLRQAMFAKGIRQIDLSNRTGIDRSKICSYVKGRYKPNAEMITKLANALSVSPDWLLGADQPHIAKMAMEEVKAPLSVEEMELIEKYRSADATKKQIIKLTLNMPL